MKISSNVGLRLVMPAAAREPSPNSNLVNYALRGLRQCWLPEHGRRSHIYHLDGRPSPNESLPHSDVFYTLNALFGMSRVQEIPVSIGVSEIFRRNALQLTTLPVAKYATALWAAAELKLEVPEQVARAARAPGPSTARWETFRAQDLGVLLTGVVAQAKAGGTEWAPFARPLYRFLSERFTSGSGLFFDAASGLRRRFASFATQTYLSIACYHYGEYDLGPPSRWLPLACTS